MLIKDLDRLWSQGVRDRDGGQCQSCRRPGNNPHHIFSRRHLSTRHDLENGVLLCWACHMHKAHGDPEAFRDFVIGRIGQEKFDRLKMRAYEVAKIDLTVAYYALKQEVDRITNAPRDVAEGRFFLTGGNRGRR